jgi:hypothetical protein
VSGYVFWCSKCKDRHAGECLRPICLTCPAGFCHQKRHHNWKIVSGPVQDLMSTYHCDGCKRDVRRSLLQTVLNTPTVAWAGPCEIP